MYTSFLIGSEGEAMFLMTEENSKGGPVGAGWR